MAQEARFERVPRTDDERHLLLQVRSPLWEHLLFAAELRSGKDTLEPKWRDHELRYVRPVGRRLSDAEALEFAQLGLAQVQVLVSNVTRVLDPSALDLAFGPPGKPGDPDRITHLAQRLIETYSALLDWAAHVRGGLVPDQYRPLTEALAKLADRPLQEMREFIDLAVAEIDAAPSWVQEHPGEPRAIDLTLTVTVNEAVLAEFNAALKQLEPTEET